MLTKADISRLLTSGLQKAFMKGYDGVASFYPEFTTEIASNKSSEDYGWLGTTPQMQEWLDERAPKALNENWFSLKNKDYEATIAVSTNAIEDDQYGQIKVRVQGMANVAKKSYDKFAVATIEANGACYDGQDFFDTDHEEGKSGVQSNIVTGAAFSANSLQSGITTMRGYKDDSWELCGINPTHVMLPSVLEWKGKEILDPTYVSVSTDPAKAVMKGALKLIVNPYLTGTDANASYYIMDLWGAVKPFIFQNRKAMQFVALDQATSPEVFMRKKIYYWVDARFAFGYGDWRYAMKLTG